MPRPAVFLDRDGVLVEETHYLHRVEDLQLIKPAPRAVARLNQSGILAVVVTNQAGVARGYYGWPQFEAVQEELERRLAPAHLDGVIACGYHPDGRGVLAQDHSFRKPRPGMIQHAASQMNLDLKRSWIVGDKLLDLEAGIRAGVCGAILVRTGYGRQMEPDLVTLACDHVRLEVADTIGEATEIVIRSIASL
ncbi:MAG: HAD family hydrolase [Bryobacteraceae bacterium]|nr:HAD family hydrolase [Bryobacteraceae bacterium]MDW8380459.1 HAD family hydrolase [Bryobacterales bacterium]